VDRLSCLLQWLKLKLFVGSTIDCKQHGFMLTRFYMWHMVSITHAAAVACRYICIAKELLFPDATPHRATEFIYLFIIALQHQILILQD